MPIGRPTRTAGRSMLFLSSPARQPARAGPARAPGSIFQGFLAVSPSESCLLMPRPALHASMACRSRFSHSPPERLSPVPCRIPSQPPQPVAAAVYQPRLALRSSCFQSVQILLTGKCCEASCFLLQNTRRGWESPSPPSPLLHSSDPTASLALVVASSVFVAAVFVASFFSCSPSLEVFGALPTSYSSYRGCVRRTI